MKKALVRNRRFGRVDVYTTNIESLESHDTCVLANDRGFDYGTFVRYCDTEGTGDKKEDFPKIERRATQADKRKIEQNMIEEKKGFDICQKKMKEFKKEMKLVSVEYTFDKTKMIFYFTAKGRIDFSDLVKDLASTFKTRIELRQIGVRDESKMIGGIGPCGRILCCKLWIREFDAVNIKMAKTQRLSLNPEKISGLCGRLLCCLRYEYFTYKFHEGKIPLEGSFVKYKDEVGQVAAVNILKGTLFVYFNDGKKLEINGSDCLVVEKKSKTRENLNGK